MKGQDNQQASWIMEDLGKFKSEHGGSWGTVVREGKISHAQY